VTKATSATHGDPWLGSSRGATKPDRPAVEPDAKPVPPKTPAGTRIIAIANQKGGVGKSTTAVSLGAALADLGYLVLVVDLDPQGNASTGMGVRHESRETTVYDVIVSDAPIGRAVVPTQVERLDAVPSTIDLAGAEIELVSQFSREMRLKKALEPIREGAYHFILLDCPPSLGLLTINALTAAEELIVPIQCEYYALEGLGQLLRNVSLVQQNINQNLRLSGIVMTMFDPRTKLSEQVVGEVQRYFGDLVYDVIIPRTVRLSEAPGFGQPITIYDPRSKGAESYQRLAREVALRPPPEEPMPIFDELPAVRRLDDAVTPEPSVELETEVLRVPTVSEMAEREQPQAEDEGPGPRPVRRSVAPAGGPAAPGAIEEREPHSEAPVEVEPRVVGGRGVRTDTATGRRRRAAAVSAVAERPPGAQTAPTTAPAPGDAPSQDSPRAAEPSPRSPTEDAAPPPAAETPAPELPAAEPKIYDIEQEEASASARRLRGRHRRTARERPAITEEPARAGERGPSDGSAPSPAIGPEAEQSSQPHPASERRVVLIDEDAEMRRASTGPDVPEGSPDPGDGQPHAKIGATLEEEGQRKRRWRLFRRGGE
jgi:chromosome partitioning protein